MRQTKALHVLYKILDELPRSAKQQREMTKFKVLWRTLEHMAIILFIFLPQLEGRSLDSLATL